MKTLFGNAFADDRVFLVKPGYIGQITHAFTSLTTRSNSLSGIYRWLIRIGAVAVGIAAGWYGSRNFATGETAMICAGGGGLIAVFISFYYTPSKFHHIFVGTEGIAEYEIDANTRNYKVLQRLRFEDATFLLNETVQNFKNGIYQNTSYKFEWYDAGGEPVFAAKSSFRRGESQSTVENKKTYFTTPRYYFLLLAEQSWTEYLRNENKKAPSPTGEHEFIVMKWNGEHEGFHYIRPHEISICSGNKNIVFAPGELKEITLEEGRLNFVPNDAIMRSGRNEVRCTISAIGNSQLFLEMATLWLNINS